MTCKQAKNRRDRELARIHILKKELDMADEKYRNMLHSVGGNRSAGKMDQFARTRVLKHLESLQRSTNKKQYPGRPHNCDDVPQLKKIEALLTVNKKPWSYADGIARQMYSKDRVAFCNPTELSAVITALVKEFGDNYA